MKRSVENISLSDHEGNISISLEYADTIPNDVVYSSTLLEKYSFPKTDNDRMAALVESISLKQPMIHMDSSAAYMTKTLRLGGGNLSVNPDIIDISLAVERKYPFIIDTESDTDLNIYYYRVVTYAQPTWEKATQYVAGVNQFNPLIYNEYLPEHEYIAFLDKEDLAEFIPNNIDGIIEWGNHNNLFHETHRLRRYGEIEDFKFTKYYTTAWLNETTMLYMNSNNIINNENVRISLYPLQNEINKIGVK